MKFSKTESSPEDPRSVCCAEASLASDPAASGLHVGPSRQRHEPRRVHQAWRAMCCVLLGVCVLTWTSESAARRNKAPGLAPTGEARAESAAPRTPTENTDCVSDSLCRQLVIRARALSMSGQFAQALDAYEGAYALHPSPTLLVNIGRLQYKLGLPHESTSSLRRALAQIPRQDSEKVELVTHFLMEAQALAAKTPPPGSSVVRINVPPPVVKVESPFYKRWPFWAAVGTLTAVGVAGVVLGASVALSASPAAEAHYPAVPTAAALQLKLR